MPLTKINNRSLSGALTSAQITDGSITSAKLADSYATIVGTVGKVKKQKVQSYLGSNTVFNSGSNVAVCQIAITVAQGSDVFVTFNGEGNGNVGDAWQWVQLFRDNTAIGTSTISVLRNSWNEHFGLTHWDTNLAAGTYTYSCKVRNGANYFNWGEHSTPWIEAIEFA